MNKVWSLFWKLFVVAVAGLLAASIVAGLIMKKPDFIFLKIQQIVAFSLGICGFISFVVIPLEMYLADKKLSGNAV